MFLRPLRSNHPAWRTCKNPPCLPRQSSSNIHHTSPSKSAAPSHSFPTIPTCPSPTCACSPTPQMPEGLPIDHSKPLNGSMAPYAMQLLVCTGKEDWPSRIEEDEGGDNLVADVKELVGRGGVFSDPYHNILLTNSSLPPSLPPPRLAAIQNTSAYLFPSFKYIPFLPRVSFDAVEALVQGYLLPRKLNKAHDALSPIHRDRLVQKEARKRELWGVRDVEEVVVLVCGHGGRDMRCGVMAPVLRREFEAQLRRQDVTVLEGPVEVTENILREAEKSRENHDLEEKQAARVAAISHIGGHKFAGNVIVYIPPKWRGQDGKESQLAGKGVWYGRVEPKHVEGIVRETVKGGRVIEELFRGGVGKDGEVLRL